MSARHRKHSRAVRDARRLVEALTSRFVTCPIADALTIKVELDAAREQLAALEANAPPRTSGPEGRAEGQSPAVGNVDHSNETVSSRAESEPAVDLLRATVNRLMGERDALAGALRALTSMADRYSDSDAYLGAAMKRARAALAQLEEPQK